MDYFHHYLERIVGVLMVVMGVKSFSRSGKVAGIVEEKDGSIAKSFHFWLKKRQENKKVSQKRARIHRSPTVSHFFLLL